MAGTVKKLQFSEGIDVGAPTDLGIASSTKVITSYVDDAAYVLANGAAISGSVYLNSTIGKFRYYVDSAWRNAVPESDLSDATKTFLVSVSGNSTGVSATLTFAATANRAYTYPDVSGIVGLVPATGVVKSNGSLLSSSNVDLTSEVTGILPRANGGTGITSTATFPSSGVVVTEAATETLSSKTLASPLISGGSIDVSTAGALAIGASVGANNLTLGGASSTVVVAGNLLVSGTTVTINSATIDVLDPNITVNKTGNDASSEGAGITVDRTGTKGSLIYAAAAATKWKIGALAAEVEVMDISTAQTVTTKTLSTGTVINIATIKDQTTGAVFVNASDTTKKVAFDLSGISTATTRTWAFPDASSTFVGINTAQVITLKDIDGGTASNTSRITLPKAATGTLAALTRKQGTVVYDTSLNKPYYDDGSTLQPFGSGSGSGGINYISANSDFEAGTTGWATYADAAATTPVDGTGGSPNSTFAASASSPLRGTQSGLFTKGAANRQGEGFSYAFTIDSADKSKTLQINAEIEVSAAYTGQSGSEYMGCYVYDVTNAVIISPSQVNINGSGKFVCAFGATTSTSYRLIFHVIGTGTSAYTLKIDTVAVGPQISAQGAAVSDWFAFTPTGSWVSNVTYTGYYRRVGDSMEIEATVLCSGAPTAASLTINLPSGFTIDTAKLSNLNDCLIGMGTALDSGANNFPCVVKYNTTTAVSVRAINAASTIALDSTVNATNPITFGASDLVQIHVKVPISQWTGSGTVQLADRAVEEYASNSSVSDADDTSSFVNGSAGSLMPGSTFTSTRRKRVRFQNPIQKSDVLILEAKGSNANAQWMPVIGAGLNDINGPTQLVFTGSNTYGIAISPGPVTLQTDIDVIFGQYKIQGTTYNSTGTNWDGSTGVISWRVRKVSGGASVGYPVSASNLFGQIDGNVIPSNHIGENLTTLITADTSANATGNTENDITGATLSNLGAGVWYIGFQGLLKINDAGAGSPREIGVRVRILTSGGTVVTGSASNVRINTTSGQDTYPWITGSAIVTIAATTSYKLGLTSDRGNGTAGNVTFKGVDVGQFTGVDQDCKIFAWRIG